MLGGSPQSLYPSPPAHSEGEGEHLCIGIIKCLPFKNLNPAKVLLQFCFKQHLETECGTGHSSPLSSLKREGSLFVIL